MEKRRLGRSGHEVGAVCLGTMTFGLQTDEPEARRQMDIALERGVDFFDTAELYAVPPSAETYGVTESIIGRWFADRKNRDKVFLATKIGGEGVPWIREGHNRIDRKNLLSAVESSLERLQTDWIDLYQLHWPNRGSYHFGQHWAYQGGPGSTEKALSDIQETLETLGQLVSQGKIRFVGLSNETAWGTMKYLETALRHGLPRIVSIQNEYSLLKRLFEPDLTEIALREEVGLLAWSPLATGLLTGKYASKVRPKGSRWSIEARSIHRDTPAAHRAVAAYQDLAARHGVDPVHLSLAFVHTRPFVTSTIIGARTSEQLEHNLGAFDLTLSEEILQDINTVRREYPMPF
jgi:aryl-alcohol dehydrogenase-like predicted oxidoreductase